jgi:hypothetical protein
MVDMFIGCQFSIKKFLHNKAMFGFIKAFTNHNIAIPVLDINANKDLVANWFPISFVKGIMIHAKPFSHNGQRTTFNRTIRWIAIQFNSFERITVTAEAMVMKAAHSFNDCLTRTFGNRAIHKHLPFLDVRYTLPGTMSRGECDG